MEVLKKTVSLLVLSDLKQVRNRRKFSFRLLIINLFILAAFFWILSDSYSLKIKLSLILFTLLLIIPGIFLIRLNNGESDYFEINISLNKLVHKHRYFFNRTVYVAKYSLNNIKFIHIKKINLNSDDEQNYRVRLYLKSKKYIDIGYFATSHQSFKIAKTISKFLKIPLKY